MSSSSISCPEGYELAFQDEFDQDGVDTQNWSFQYGAGGWGNGELQNYTDQNAEVSNGVLTITAKVDTHVANARYSSSRITTRGKFSFKYGIVEARIALPIQRGMWPALWALPEESPYGGWPHSGEIDIMERLLGEEEAIAKDDDPTISSSAVHFADENGNHKYLYAQNQAASSLEEFHTYGLVWEENSIKTTVDGKTIFEVTSEDYAFLDEGGSDAPFDQKFYLLLNLAVGGQTADPLNDFEQDQLKVDYIRVYQKA